MSASPEAATRPERKSDRTRRRIIDAASSLLAERGYAGTRMVDIGERAELRDGSLYYYFASKDELVEEILRSGVEQTHASVRAAVEALPATAGPVDRLRAAIRAHLESLLELSDRAAAALRVMAQVPPELSRSFRRAQSGYGAYWNRLLKDAVEAGAIRGDLDLTAVRLFLIGALNWVVDWPPSTRRSAARLAEVAEAMLVEGLEID